MRFSTELGKLRVDARRMLVCDQQNARPRLAIEAPIGPFEGKSGEALWCCSERESGPRVAGHWHVQCVDRDTVLAEHSVFAEDEV
jgi:hypothetical protein